MKVDELAMVLNENMMSDFHARAKELRSLNHSGKDIVSTLAKEFNKSADSVEKMLLPQSLKGIDSFGKREINKLRKQYPELNNIQNDDTFIKKVKEKAISKK